MATLTARERLVGPFTAPVTPEGRRFLELLAPHLSRVRDEAAQHDWEGTFPTEIFESFLMDGTMGATVPSVLGGVGVGSLHDVALALSRLAEADASTALALHAQLSRGLTLTYEWQHGSDAVRVLAAHLLGLMAEGKAAVCGGVRDHPSPSGTTELYPDGAGGWLLSGRKAMVTMAPVATHFVVLARAQLDDGAPALVAPVLARDTPGLTVLENWHGMGMRASGTCDVVLEQCPVASEHVMSRGRIGAGSDAVLAGQTVSSITQLGIYVGIAQAARDTAVASVIDRGTAPPSAVRTLLAELDSRLFSLRATVEAALTNADRESADLTGDLDARGRAMMLPYQWAKMAVNKMAVQTVDDSMTLVGGPSYTASHPLSRYYRDVRAGGFMQPYTYPDAVEFLSAQTLGIDRDNDYLSVRTARASRQADASH